MGVFDPQPFKEITYKCTQTSTNAPAIAYTLGDSFGQPLSTAPAWARTGAGVYTFTKTGAWVANKTVAVVVSNNSAARICQVVYTSADVITLNFFDAATPAAAESGSFDLIIRVYA